MNKSTTTANENTRYLSSTGLMEYLSVGRNTADKIAKEAKAKFKIGRRVLYDKKRIDDYLETLMEEL